MAKCIYCDTEEFSPGLTVSLCQQHMELRAIAWVLTKKGQAVTAESVRAFVELLADPIAIQLEEIPLLLAQMNPKENRPS